MISSFPLLMLIAEYWYHIYGEEHIKIINIYLNLLKFFRHYRLEKMTVLYNLRGNTSNKFCHRRIVKVKNYIKCLCLIKK
jgi:hypothetical protein